MVIAFRSNSQIAYPIPSAGAFTAALAVRQAGLAGAPSRPGPRDHPCPTLQPSHREGVRPWIKRYIFFHSKRHPAEMGTPEVTAFLTSLAVQDKVAASTQNQAVSALLFLYREVLGVELP